MSSQDFSHGVGGPGASPNPLVPVRLPIFAPVIIVRISGQLETLLSFLDTHGTLFSYTSRTAYLCYYSRWGFSGILLPVLGKRCTRPASFRHRCFESDKTFVGSYDSRLC